VRQGKQLLLEVTKNEGMIGMAFWGIIGKGELENYSVFPIAFMISEKF
jgi:hypothetical protein